MAIRDFLNVATFAVSRHGNPFYVKRSSSPPAIKANSVAPPISIHDLAELRTSYDIEELKGRFRREGVETLLVNSYGRPWSADGFGGSFNRIRDAVEFAFTDPEDGMARAKHFHDLRGTFATKLIIHPANLTDHEVADIMGWSPQQVADIRRLYVDQARVVVAIGQRIRGAL